MTPRTVIGFPERDPEPFVDRKQLAERFNVGIATVDRWVARGCPSETWGMRARRFQPSKVLAWLRTRERERLAA